ncbi:MAG: LysM domain-containing protein [Opitutaceae bacterium]|nr:LysM domain-containing protein [Opitutaceae bacterium]
MKRRLRFISLVLATTASAAEPAVEFSGVLVADGRPKIALTDKNTRITRWVDPGAEFNGYKVARYVADEDAVLLQKDGQEIRLLLIPAKSPEGPPAPSGTLRPATPVVAAAKPVVPAPAPVLAPEPPTPTPSTGPATATGNAAITRSIEPGETLQTIARTAGLSVEQLKVLNPTLNEGSLQPGQVIRIR